MNSDNTTAGIVPKSPNKALNSSMLFKQSVHNSGEQYQSTTDKQE